MLLTEDKQIDIFVASKIGSFKHIKFHTDTSKNSKKCIENLVPIKSLEKDDCITCMEWGNEAETEIMIGQRNQQIKVYDTLQGFQKSYTADFGTGNIVGLGRYKRRVIAAVASGAVKVWRKKEDCVIDTGGKLDVMKMCPDEPTLFATGGEENDLKVWRIGTPTAVFSAKNLSHDWLQLRRPVWVSGLAWGAQGGGAVVAAASRHGYVRLYDTRAQRRPVLNVEFPKMAATCIAPGFHERLFLVGFGRGQLHQVDLRVGRPDKGYKGAVGAITSIATAEVGSTRAVVSASADRHIRVHQHDTKDILYKQYLTSKLSCVLVQSKSSTPLLHATEPEPSAAEESEIKEEEEDMDQLFDGMETVGEKAKRKTEIPSEPDSKKLKPSVEGSTIDVDLEEEEEEEDSEAIKKLLRSTEKQKKKLDKKKKAKKAKSVFHNA
ncbi:hypothetical protein O0L34_g11960 [Tuta absoluta]|nr:hypothetical protein O0L34_g11960 [Tuta absoluta]